MSRNTTTHCLIRPNHKSRLVILDSENLACRPMLTNMDAISICLDTRHAISPQKGDIVLVGGHYGNRGPCEFIARYLNGSAHLQNGKNGAELALMKGLRQIPLSRIVQGQGSIRECVIGSGDHFFIDFAKEMKSCGLAVTVMSKPRSLSRDLAQHANRVILLGPTTSQSTALAA